jgi:signal transduction histidine kinase
MGPHILTGQDGLRDAVEQLSQTTQELVADIHRLSYQLHPFKLDQLGLSASIEILCAELAEHQALKVRFRQQGLPVELPDDATLCVYRIAQESLHNVVKHSGATEAEVVLSMTRDAVRLRVTDNGSGFDLELAKGKKRLGLISMRERLRLVEGRVSIRSQPGQGTQIDAFIPLCRRTCVAKAKIPRNRYVTSKALARD